MWRSRPPERTSSASASCSMAPVWRSVSCLAAATGSTRAGREHHPAEPQTRRQALAGRAHVDDPVGVHALERADGLAVVAELAVVVVLHHVGVAALGPRR